MGTNFKVNPVKKYRAGYPGRGFFRKSFVAAVPIKFFSFLVIGMLFFITVPGCDEKEELEGIAPPECMVDEDCGEGFVCDESANICVEKSEGADDMEIIPEEDVETNDFDEVDGLPQPECTANEDCEDGYYCDTATYTCVEELGGVEVPECTTDEDCEEDFYCDTETYTCVEEMLGDPVPDQMPDEDSTVSDEAMNPDDGEEAPDEELGGIAPPELKS